MGLEIVEFVLAIEERFQIAIPDDQVDSVRTVGDMVAMIQLKLADIDGSGYEYRKARVFYLFRSLLMRECGVGRDEIRPNSELESLLPAVSRRKSWRALRDAGLSLPSLTLMGKIPNKCRSVGDAVEFLAMNNPILGGIGVEPDTDIERTVFEIVVEQLDVRIEDLRSDLTWKELGVP